MPTCVRELLLLVAASATQTLCVAYSPPPGLEHCLKPFDFSWEGLLSSDELETIVQQLDVCGFITIAPGLISHEWVSTAYSHMESRWQDMEWVKKHARAVQGGGRRVDHVLQLDEGPFNTSMFDAFSSKVFQIAKVGPTAGGTITRCTVMNAPNNTYEMPKEWRKDWNIFKHEKSLLDLWHGEQMWHSDSQSERKYVYYAVALQDIKREGGMIGVQPGCLLGKGEHGGPHCQGLEDLQKFTEGEGYMPEEMKAGTMLIHKTQLLHRGNKNIVQNNRFMLVFETVPKERLSEVRRLYATVHHSTPHARRIAKKRESMFEARLKSVLAEAKAAGIDMSRRRKRKAKAKAKNAEL